jgi:hypothetical protein
MEKDKNSISNVNGNENDNFLTLIFLKYAMNKKNAGAQTTSAIIFASQFPCGNEYTAHTPGNADVIMMKTGIINRYLLL